MAVPVRQCVQRTGSSAVRTAEVSVHAGSSAVRTAEVTVRKRGDDAQEWKRMLPGRR